MADDALMHGSGNVFADLGFADAEELQCKALLTYHIYNRIKALGLTQKEAGGRLGISQADVSRLMHCRHTDFSSDHLRGFLLALDVDAAQWEAFIHALETPLRSLPRLKRLFSQPSVFEPCGSTQEEEYPGREPLMPDGDDLPDHDYESIYGRAAMWDRFMARLDALLAKYNAREGALKQEHADARPRDEEAGA